MTKIRQYFIPFEPIVIWFFLTALFFDVANIDDFFPSIECVHADDAEILSMSDSYQDAVNYNPLRDPLSQPQYKSCHKYLFLRYDFDSPAYLDCSYYEHLSFNFNFVPVPSTPVEPEADRYLFIEFCSFLI